MAIFGNDTAAKDAERRANMKQSFEAFLDNPMVRMTMATIPPGSNPEALRMLLQSTFDAGYQTGGVVAVLDLMLEMAKKKGME